MKSQVTMSVIPERLKPMILENIKIITNRSGINPTDFETLTLRPGITNQTPRILIMIIPEKAITLICRN